ncbi:hypothetical protein GWK47_043563 [Chionoecetes opilio]|uniref:Uncharacterized protein n=1 Tax=Chionoecetes opilio TaxID=41210 RepID=A0A8J5CW35_CHIOP|nr:hypothetical protein GWK47_043563 [Chionoecetes opilio]
MFGFPTHSDRGLESVDQMTLHQSSSPCCPLNSHARRGLPLLLPGTPPLFLPRPPCFGPWGDRSSQKAAWASGCGNWGVCREALQRLPCPWRPPAHKLRILQLVRGCRWHESAYSFTRRTAPPDSNLHRGVSPRSPRWSHRSGAPFSFRLVPATGPTISCETRGAPQCRPGVGLPGPFFGSQTSAQENPQLVTKDASAKFVFPPGTCSPTPPGGALIRAVPRGPHFVNLTRLGGAQLSSPGGGRPLWGSRPPAFGRFGRRNRGKFLIFKDAPRQVDEVAATDEPLPSTGKEYEAGMKEENSESQDCEDMECASVLPNRIEGPRLAWLLEQVQQREDELLKRHSCDQLQDFLSLMCWEAENGLVSHAGPALRRHPVFRSVMVRPWQDYEEEQRQILSDDTTIMVDLCVEDPKKEELRVGGFVLGRVMVQLLHQCEEEQREAPSDDSTVETRVEHSHVEGLSLEWLLRQVKE